MTTDDISGLIPEIYYDLIARVAAGVSVIAVITSPSWSQIQQLETVTLFIALLGVGYVVGHLLTTVSVLLNAIIWRPWFVKFTMQFVPELKYGFDSIPAGGIFTIVYARIDWVAKKDRSGGSVLKKMEAGAALTDSLLAGWAIAGMCYLLTNTVPWGWRFANARDIVLFILVTVLLLFSVPIRRLIFIVRQDRILKMLKYDPNAVEGQL
jgi:hypothetical protein